MRGLKKVRRQPVPLVQNISCCNNSLYACPHKTNFYAHVINNENPFGANKPYMVAQRECDNAQMSTRICSVSGNLHLRCARQQVVRAKTFFPFLLGIIRFYACPHKTNFYASVINNENPFGANKPYMVAQRECDNTNVHEDMFRKWKLILALCWTASTTHKDFFSFITWDQISLKYNLYYNWDLNNEITLKYVIRSLPFVFLATGVVAHCFRKVHRHGTTLDLNRAAVPTSRRFHIHGGRKRGGVCSSTSGGKRCWKHIDQIFWRLNRT
jgi:hypothetical protein